MRKLKALQFFELAKVQQFRENTFRLLESLKRDGIKTDTVSTDRYLQIRKVMRVNPSFNDIKHQFDQSHVAKSICKRHNKKTETSYGNG